MDLYSIESSMTTLEKKGYVERDKEDEFRVKITSSGSDWLLNNAKYVLSGEKEWRIPPEEYHQHQIKVHEFYTPIISKLDKQFFGKYSIKGGS